MNGRLTDTGNPSMFEDYGLTELLDEEYHSHDDVADWREALRSALHENYAQAPSEEVEDTLFNMLETLEPAEAFNFTKALSSIAREASNALKNPTVAQIANAGLPVVGGAVGGVFGGPVGAALGSSLGKTAAKSLPSRNGAAPAPAPPQSTAPAGIPAQVPPPPPPLPPAFAQAPAPAQVSAMAPVPPDVAAAATPSTTSVSPAVSAGSKAALQGLVMTMQPEVQKALLALALGQHGARTVNGVEVGGVMNMLNRIFTTAAADADELLYTRERVPGYLVDSSGGLRGDPAVPTDRAQSLYAALVQAGNAQLAEEQEF